MPRHGRRVPFRTVFGRPAATFHRTTPQRLAATPAPSHPTELPRSHAQTATPHRLAEPYFPAFSMSPLSRATASFHFSV